MFSQSRTRFLNNSLHGSPSYSVVSQPKQSDIKSRAKRTGILLAELLKSCKRRQGAIGVRSVQSGLHNLYKPLRRQLNTLWLRVAQPGTDVLPVAVEPNADA